MHEDTVRTRAFAMPLTSPAYPIGPYRFRNREYLIITYRTDPQKLRELVPEPLQVREPLVKFEFIRMPDSTGFGDYTESGQVIPVTFRGRKGSYTHCMFLNDHPPIAGGRELWGFPKKLASPTLRRVAPNGPAHQVQEFSREFGRSAFRQALFNAAWTSSSHNKSHKALARRAVTRVRLPAVFASFPSALARVRSARSSCASLSPQW